MCYSRIDVQVSEFVFAEVLCPLLHVPEDDRRHKLSQRFWEVFITPTYMFDSLILHPLGDPSSFTSPSRRLRAALIAANTEAGEKFQLCGERHSRLYATFSLTQFWGTGTSHGYLGSQGLIELPLDCRSCHCCVQLWKHKAAAPPLTSFRDESRRAESCRRCPFILPPFLSVLELRSRTELSSKLVVWCFSHQHRGQRRKSHWTPLNKASHTLIYSCIRCLLTIC